MRRFEALQQIMKAVGNEPLVCNIGHPSQELFSIRDRKENFYMLGSMGLASSIGLGISLSSDRKIVVIEGDAAVTMNMGTLATIGKNKPKNLLLIIIDNGANGSTGDQPSFTAENLDLEGVAKSCGIENTLVLTEEEGIYPVILDLLQLDEGPYLVVIKTEQGVQENVSVIPIDGLTIKDRFRTLFNR